MKIIKNFLYNIIYQVLMLIVPLVTIPYISAVLGSTGVGDYAFTYANTQYFIILGMIGISLYGSREIAYVRDNKSKLKTTFYSIYIIQVIGISVALALFLIFTFNFNNDYYKILYLYQAINIVAAIFDISWFFIGIEEFKKTVMRNMFVKLVSLISIFIFVNNEGDILKYISILSISVLIGNVIFWFYLPKYIEARNIRINNVKKHFKASISLFIPQIAIQIYWILDKTLLGIISNNVSVGYYDNSQKLVKMSLTVVTALSTVMMPQIANNIANNNMKKVKEYIEKSFLFIFFITIPIVFGLMAIANKMSPWFFTEEFIGIDKLIIIGSLVVIPISFSNVTGTQLLVPIDRVKQYTISVSAGALVNLILNILLIGKFNAIGACIATILAECTVSLLQFYFVRDIISPIKLLKKVFIFLPSGLIMYIIVVNFGSLMEDTIVTTITQCIIGIISYLIILEFQCRAIYKESLIRIFKRSIKTFI